MTQPESATYGTAFVIEQLGRALAQAEQQITQLVAANQHQAERIAELQQAPGEPADR
jgi:hypothetical protein